MKKTKILILFLVLGLIIILFSGCIPTISSPPSKITNAENNYKNSNMILDIPYFDAQGVTNGCGCAAGAMIMNYYNYLDVEPADLAPYIMVPESKYWETFGLLAGIEAYIKYYNYDDNLKTELKILTIEDIKRKIDEGFPVAVLQYSDLPRITENLHYRVVHGYDDEKLEFICSCSLGEDYPMDYSEFINLNLLPVDKCPALIIEPKNIDFSFLDVVPPEGNAPHEVHFAGWIRAVVSPFHCKVDFGDGTPIEEGTGNEFLSLYHTYANEGKFTPVLYVEDNLGRKGKAKANTITVTSSTQDENKIPFISGDSFAGYEWDVRNYPGKPGSVDQIWSDSINNIWMDDLGQLHFRLTKKNDNKWNCVEIFSQKTDWGYGKYEFDFEIVSDGKIDENVMIGLYAYSDSPELYHGEFDYEFTYWSPEGLDPSNNSTVGWQGDPVCLKRFYIPIEEGYPTKIVLYWNYWEDEEIYCYYKCGSIEGDFSLPQDADSGGMTPPPTELNQRVYMNLWLETGKPYNSEEIEEVEVVIKDFDFQEKPEDVNRPPEISDLTANPSSVDINQTTTITCIASDPDGDPLTYYWTKNGGSFEGDTSGSTVTWKAPSTEGNYTITCEVSDGETSDNEQVVITVTSYPVHNLTKNTYYNTIQAALDDADSGDTIEVDDGTYDESIIFPNGKKIILQSINGRSSTIIRGDDGSNTVTLSNSLEGTTLEGFTITHESGNSGRGINMYDGYLIIKNSNIFDNSITDFVGNHTGGAIFTTRSCELTINGSTISGNYASSGGAISAHIDDNITINGSTISGNSSAYVGGAIYSYYCTLTINESTISNNTTTETTLGSGGAIFQPGGILTINESTISNNSAALNGGGISARVSSNIFITNSTISNNTALKQYGGGIYCSTEEKINLTITGSILSGNSAFLYGGGIYLLPEFMGTITIGGSSENDLDNFNQFINNYKIGDEPSPDQHISNFKRDCHMDYPYNNYSPDTPPPDAPVLYNLFYNPSSGANYDMTWSDESSSGAAGYEIEESEYSDFSSICGGMSTMSTSCTFGHDVTENTYFYYRVRSMSSEGVYSEEWSNTVEVMVEGIPKASITVVTRDHNGSLISGGISYILYDDSNPWNAISNSGSSSSNNYTFDDLEAGTYNIESYKYNDYTLQGFYGTKIDISLLEGQNKNVTIYTSAISVCTKDSNGNLISGDGLSYCLYLEDGSGTWHKIREVPAPSNNYTFTKIPSGTYNIEAYTNSTHRGTIIDVYVAPQDSISREIVAIN